MITHLPNADDSGPLCGTVTDDYYEIITDPEEYGDTDCSPCAEIAGIDLEEVGQ